VLLETAGLDALVVNTDQWYSSSGLHDLYMVARATRRVPVLRRDWFLHPLQVLETQQSGAAGVLGIVAQVSARGTPLMSSFAASLGLDAPVEIVNTAELDFLAAHNVPMYALQCRCVPLLCAAGWTRVCLTRACRMQRGSAAADSWLCSGHVARPPRIDSRWHSGAGRSQVAGRGYSRGGERRYVCAAAQRVGGGRH